MRLLFALLPLLALTAPVAAAEKPNVVYFMTDELGYDELK